MTPSSSPSADNPAIRWAKKELKRAAPKPVCPVHHKRNPAGGEGGVGEVWCTCSTKPMKAVEGCAIYDQNNMMLWVEPSPSMKFTWRKFSGLKSYDEATTEYYRKAGYRCIRVQILPLSK